jgi:hypothetical protein
MNKEIHIFFPSLQQITGCQVIQVKGLTIQECLDDLIIQFPGAKNWIYDSDGKLLDYVFVYINAESTHKASLSCELKPDDKLILALMVTGG